MAVKCCCIALLLFLVLGCNAPGQKQAAGEEAVEAGPDVTAHPAVQDSALPEKTPLNRMDYDTAEWADLALLDSTILIDLKYATEDNFVEEKMYECGRCFLRPEVARRVVAVHRGLQQQGLRLKMLDCYRPRPVQWKLWEKVPDRRYVSDPRKGSMHNRGAAVDLTITDGTGRELNMGTPYDYFGPEAHPSYQGLPDSVLANRKLLREAMARQGFSPIRTEWWHYSFSRKTYELSDVLWKCY